MSSSTLLWLLFPFSPTPEPRFFCCLTWTVIAFFLLFLFYSCHEANSLPCHVQLSCSRTQSRRDNQLWTRTSEIPFLFTTWWSQVICYNNGKLKYTPKESRAAGMSLLLRFFTTNYNPSHHSSCLQCGNDSMYWCSVSQNLKLSSCSNKWMQGRKNYGLIHWDYLIQFTHILGWDVSGKYCL